jgi:hypothetical protein
MPTWIGDFPTAFSIPRRSQSISAGPASFARRPRRDGDLIRLAGGVFVDRVCRQAASPIRRPDRLTGGLRAMSAGPRFLVKLSSRTQCAASPWKGDYSAATQSRVITANRLSCMTALTWFSFMDISGMLIRTIPHLSHLKSQWPAPEHADAWCRLYRVDRSHASARHRGTRSTEWALVTVAKTDLPACHPRHWARWRDTDHAALRRAMNGFNSKCSISVRL